MLIKLIEDGKAPEYKTKGAAGADCYARESVVINAGETVCVPLGFALQLPEGFEAQVRGRSSMARKYGIFTHLGTIDSDYRGEVSVLLFNTTKADFYVNKGDRVAQIVITRARRVGFTVTDELDDTERGEGGFGSTGK